MAELGLTDERSDASVADCEGLLAVERDGKYTISVDIDGDDTVLCDDANQPDESTAACTPQRQLYMVDTHQHHSVCININPLTPSVVIRVPL